MSVIAIGFIILLLYSIRLFRRSTRCNISLVVGKFQHNLTTNNTSEIYYSFLPTTISCWISNSMDLQDNYCPYTVP